MLTLGQDAQLAIYGTPGGQVKVPCAIDSLAGLQREIARELRVSKLPVVADLVVGKELGLDAGPVRRNPGAYLLLKRRRHGRGHVHQQQHAAARLGLNHKLRPETVDGVALAVDVGGHRLVQRLRSPECWTEQPNFVGAVLHHAVRFRRDHLGSGNDPETTRGRFSFDPFAKPCRVWL